MVVRLLCQLAALIRGRRPGGSLLEVQIHAVCTYVEDLLWVHLLLLVQRYLVVELLEQLLWVREHVVLLVVLLLLVVLFAIAFLVVPGVYHGLVLGQGCQVMVVVVAIELGLN